MVAHPAARLARAGRPMPVGMDLVTDRVIRPYLDFAFQGAKSGPRRLVNEDLEK